MPPLAVALYLAVGSQAGEHPVQVVRLDLHRLRHVRDRDPGLLANEFERLVGPRVTGPTSPRVDRAAVPAAVRTRQRSHRAVTRQTASRSRSAGQRRPRGLKPRGLVLQLTKPIINVLDLSVNKLRQASHLSINGSNRTRQSRVFPYRSRRRA